MKKNKILKPLEKVEGKLQIVTIGVDQELTHAFKVLGRGKLGPGLKNILATFRTEILSAAKKAS